MLKKLRCLLDEVYALSRWVYGYSDNAAHMPANILFAPSSPYVSDFSW